MYYEIQKLSSPSVYIYNILSQYNISRIRRDTLMKTEHDVSITSKFKYRNDSER